MGEEKNGGESMWESYKSILDLNFELTHERTLEVFRRRDAEHALRLIAECSKESSRGTNTQLQLAMIHFAATFGCKDSTDQGSSPDPSATTPDGETPAPGSSDLHPQSKRPLGESSPKGSPLNCSGGGEEGE